MRGAGDGSCVCEVFAWLWKANRLYGESTS